MDTNVIDDQGPPDAEMDALAKAARNHSRHGEGLRDRKQREGRVLHPRGVDDGRAARATERDVQLNVGVTKEIKALVAGARAKYGIWMRSFVERAIEEYVRKLEEEGTVGEVQ